MREKKIRDKDEALRAFIRTLPCVGIEEECGIYSGFNERLGEPRNEASHVLKWGSWNGDRNNLVPHCNGPGTKWHHKTFEDLPPEKRKELQPLAVDLSMQFYARKAAGMI